MFKEEIKAKLNVKDKLLPYTLNVLGSEGTIVSGVKKVLASTPTQVSLRATKVIKIVGDNLSIAEIGGGDVYIKGQVTKVEFE